MFSVIFVVLSVLKLTTSYSQCAFPCNWQAQDFYNEKEDITLQTTASSLYIPEADLTIDCYLRSGPFIVNRRNGNQYRCIKIIDVCKDAFVVLQTDIVTSYSPPELCDICDGAQLSASKPEVWVAKASTEIGCNVPKDCPAGYGNTPCTGYETNTPDDGMNCGAYNYGETNTYYYKGKGKGKGKSAMSRAKLYGK